MIIKYENKKLPRNRKRRIERNVKMDIEMKLLLFKSNEKRKRKF